AAAEIRAVGHVGDLQGRRRQPVRPRHEVVRESAAVKRLLVLTAAVLALSCGGGSSPTGPLGDIARGTFNGLVTLAPGPAQPSAYQSRKVQVWDAARTKLLF